MSDITTVWDVSRGRGDWIIAGAALQSGDDLSTAVYISLFTDRVATASDAIPDGTNDRRGWWGDLDQEYPIGSRLWLLDRSTLTQAVANSAKTYITEALQWLIDDGVASGFTVTTDISVRSRLAVKIVIQKPDNTTQTMTFNWAWQQLN